MAEPTTAAAWIKILSDAYDKFIGRTLEETMTLSQAQSELLQKIAYARDYLKQQPPETLVGATARATYTAWLAQAEQNDKGLKAMQEKPSLPPWAAGVGIVLAASLLYWIGSRGVSTRATHG